MATFEERVEGLIQYAITGSTNPSQDELTEFLKDGVLDVTNRCIALNPSEAIQFATVSSEQTSNGLDLSGAKIISVVRESGTNNDWRECRLISPHMQSRVTDANSLEYASKYNPAYTVLDDGDVHVFPAPGADPNAFKVYYVNNSPLDNSGTSLTYADSDLSLFPSDKVYLVVLYASIQSLNAVINIVNYIDITGEDPTKAVSPTLSMYGQSLPTFTTPNSLVLPAPPAGVDVDFTSVGSIENFVSPVFSIPTLGAISSMNLPNIPVPPAITSNSVTISGTAPTYVQPIFALENKPTISDLSISTVIPVSPTLDSSSIDTTGLTNPTFTPPVMTTPDWSDVNTWISTEEDSEMSGARVQEIQGKISEYSARIQESQAQFNKESAILNKDLQIAMQNANTYEQSKLSKYSAELQSYQGEVNKEVQEWQLNYQKELSLWSENNSAGLQKYQADVQANLQKFNEENVEYQAKLQKDMQDAQLEESKDSRELQKYVQQLQSYQAEVGKETQRWTGEVFNKEFNEWQQKYQGQLQEYQAGIQKETARVGASMQDFQAQVSKALQKYQAETGYDMSKYQAELQANIQKYQSDLSRNQSDFETSIAKYTSEIQRVSSDNQSKIAKFSAEVQNYSAQSQKIISKIQIYVERYNALKKEYNEAFMLMSPQRQQEQGRRQ